eukprot:5563937-Lingulodinium_polyedra.AAC.1
MQAVDAMAWWCVTKGALTRPQVGAALKLVRKPGANASTCKGWRGVQALCHSTKCLLQVVCELHGDELIENLARSQF